MSGKDFRLKHEAVRDKCRALADEAMKRAIAPTATDADKIAALDEAQALRLMADRWGESASYADRARDDQQGKGRDRLNAGRKLQAANAQDEVRSVWRPGLSAEQVRRRLSQQGTDMKLRTIQNHIKKIRQDGN